MRRFIAMHEGEAGFESTEAVEKWIASTRNEPEKWRVVEIIVDPVTEKVANLKHKIELDEAYRKGYETHKEEMIQRLGLL